MVAAGEAAGERRQQNGTQRHAQHAGGELHQAVGIVHPRHRTGDQKRGKNGVDDQRDLADRNPKNSRAHLLNDADRSGIAQADARQHQHADLFEVRQLVEKLQYAADGDRPGQRQHRRVKQRCGKERKANHADV